MPLQRLIRTFATASSLRATNSALQKIEQLASVSPDKILRIAVDFGGCHGFQYKFALVEKQKAEKQEIVQLQNECVVAMDEASARILSGAELDWQAELRGSAFVLRNIAASENHCGCGASFDLQSRKAE